MYFVVGIGVLDIDTTAEAIFTLVNARPNVSGVNRVSRRVSSDEVSLTD